MKAMVFTCAKVVITALLFLYVFRNIDFHEFGSTLKNARPGILICGFLVLWIGHYICICRWRMLMRPLMPVLSLSYLFGIYCIGLFFNLTFPTVVGGDVVKMYFAAKPSKSYAQSFAATFLDRDAGMLAMMIIACIAIIIHPVRVPRIPVPLIIWGAFVAFVAGNLAIFAPYCHRRLTDLLHRLHLSKIALKVDTISSAFLIMGKHKALLLSSLLVSFVNQLLVISVTWIMAVGLRINVAPLWFLVFVPVITLISMVPISLNGMGLREYAFMSLFGAIGVDHESCIALGLLSSIVIVLSALPGGIVYIFLRNRNDMQQLAAIETEFS
jgi:glycosyltransferase 2 family protein